MITQNELLNEQIKYNGMSDEEFFSSEIQTWLGSENRAKMLSGREYYSGNHDIYKRKRTAIGKDGKLEEVANLPNNIIVDNRFARLIDQKKNYLLARPLTFRCDNENYYEELRQIFDAVFLRDLKNAGEEALVGGISWLYCYINELGKLKFKCFPSYEICPFWKDNAHTELDCVARVYEIQEYVNKQKKSVTMVDIYRLTGVTSYKLDGNDLIQTSNETPYISIKNKNFNWAKLPIIPIKSNNKEIPLISRIKELQDALNLILSDFMNNMEENVRNSIIVLKNYDGTDLGEFRKNLSSYGAIKTRTQDGASGGVDILRIDVNSENYKTIVELLTRSITQNAKGFDLRDSKSSSNPNQLNIKSMYSDIDLDANEMEGELLACFVDIKYFVDTYLQLLKNTDYTSTLLQVIFNRDILINESEAIDNCVKSIGILSKDSIVSQHPWVSDLQTELKAIEKMSLNVTP